MSDIVFVDGMIFKKVNENAPEWIKLKLSIKRTELINWLQNQSSDWIDIDIKESKAGKLYAAINNWKPEYKEIKEKTEVSDTLMQPDIDEPPF